MRLEREHRRKGTSTRERVVKAPRHVFARRGFAGATVNEIAETAGIRKPSLFFQYFKSKTQLYDEVVDESVRELATVLSEALTPGATLESVLHALDNFYGGDPSGARLIFNEILDERSPQNQMRGRVAAALADLCVRFPSVDANLAMSLFGIHVVWWTAGTVERSQHAAHRLRFFSAERSRRVEAR